MQKNLDLCLLGNIALDRSIQKFIFLISPPEHIWGIFIRSALMNSHNICFDGEIRKIPIPFAGVGGPFGCADW